MGVPRTITYFSPYYSSSIHINQSITTANMDGLLDKGKAMLSGGNKSGGQQPAQGAGQQDMVDKGINSVQAKFGIDKDDKYEEKATDMARSKFETGTGKKVPSKVSN